MGTTRTAARRQLEAVLISLLALVAAGCAWAPVPTRGSLFPSVAIDELKVNALVLDGQQSEGEAWLRDLMRQAATASAGQAVLDYRIAQAIHSNAPPASDYRITGVIEVPLVLPDGATGFDAYWRKGNLAVVNLTLAGPGGETVARSSVSLGWKAVEWKRGPRRFRHSRPGDAVLVDAVSEAVRRGVRALAETLLAQRGG